MSRRSNFLCLTTDRAGAGWSRPMVTATPTYDEERRYARKLARSLAW